MWGDGWACNPEDNNTLWAKLQVEVGTCKWYNTYYGPSYNSRVDLQLGKKNMPPIDVGRGFATEDKNVSPLPELCVEGRLAIG